MTRSPHSAPDIAPHAKDGSPPVGSGAAPPADAAEDAPSPWRAVALTLLVVACLAALSLTPVSEVVGPGSVQRWRMHIDALGAWGPAAFFAANALAVACGVPRLLFAALAGALFGWVAGAAIAHYAGLAGAWMTFAVGRALGREWVGSFVRRRLPRADRLLDLAARHGVAATALVRAAPVGHAFTTSLLMSLSPVRTADFLLGTFLGSLPHSVVFALFGSAAKGQHWVERVVGGAVALVIVTVAVTAWGRRIASRERAASGSPPPSR